jgi:hypothetical protein
MVDRNDIYFYRITDGLLFGSPGELVAVALDMSMEGTEDLLSDSNLNHVWVFVNFAEGFAVRVYLDLKYASKPSLEEQGVWNILIEQHVLKWRDAKLLVRQRREAASERFKDVFVSD